MENLMNIEVALSMLPNPVAVLTVADGDVTNGMIVSWMTQVSAEPPQVLVSIRANRYSHALVHSSGRFTINLLSEEQKLRVPKFKLKGEARSEKFDGLEVKTGPGNVPYLPDSAAVMHCKVVRTIDTEGDHTLFIGQVEQAEFSNKTPLSTISLGKAYSGKA